MNIIFNNNNNILTNFDNELDNELNTFLNEDIHLHYKQRGKKCQTLIVGLLFNDKEEIKKFLSTIKKKFNVSGAHKEIKELDSNNKVFEFAGDIREGLKDYMTKVLNKNEENIKIHG
jgi:translation initiation factor 1 (eIF-1/SUI1)